MLKQVLIRNPYANHCGIINACLYVDVMLQPLYWYCITNNVDYKEVGVERYQDLALYNFSKNAESIIVRIYNGLYKRKKCKSCRLLSSYCLTLRKCFPQYLNNKG
jgi:hypothetical protein